MLSLGLKRRRVFFLARLRGRSICGLRISLFGSGLDLLLLYCSILGLGSILGLSGRLGLLALALILGHHSSLSLITNLAGSFESLSGGWEGGRRA